MSHTTTTAAPPHTAPVHAPTSSSATLTRTRPGQPNIDLTEPVALIYRGPASLPGCPEAAAALLAASPWRFRVHYIGPREALQLNERALAGAALYVQPGGGTLRRGYRHLRTSRGDIRRYVHSGGRYLGLCLGGYLAGATPGFALLPGDTDQYVAMPTATVRTTADTITAVRWRGRTRYMFFQDGPHFLLDDNARASVLAEYPNGAVAALTAPYGRGRVAVSGPHPEADQSWYTGAHLTNPDGVDYSMGLDLIDAAMSS